MSESFLVTIKATSITVYPGEKASYMLEPLLNMLTYEDEFAETEKTLGFLYDSDTDILYLHKGVDINYLKRLLINIEVVSDLYHPYREMNFEYEEIIAPRDEDQVDVINFIAGLNHHANNIDQSQLFLVKKPGFGKPQPYSTRIPTPDGYTLMGSLKVGDYVLDQMGNPTKVLAIFEKGPRVVWQLTFADGRTSRCSCDHLWPVFVSNRPKYFVYDLLKMIDMKEDLRKLYLPTYKKANGNRLEIIDIKCCGYSENMRCIMVDNPDHLYLTDDYIVTHNTYCSGVGLCKYKAKTLIIMHRDSLRKQWLNSLYNMSGLSSKYVHEIATSEELCCIAKNEHEYDYDIYLMTHATFRAGMKRIPKMEYAMRITKNLGIGMKIIDEAHLEFRDTILMDMVFNVKRNLYLTATDGRSSKDENAIFRHVFSNALFYKPSSLLTDNLPKKWVEYVAVAINSHCNPNIYRYRVAGGRGMSNATYGKWVIAYDKKKTHFNCCKDIIKVIYERDPHAKILLFMPLIDLCEECAYFLKMNLGKDDQFQYDLDIRTINSKNSKRDNENAKRADVIVTTIASCGTGTDIPGITGIISCSPYVSGITAEQVFGRIRYCGKVCQYYDIYDRSVQLDVFWWKGRSKKLKHLALNTFHMNWEPDVVIDNETK